MGRVACIAISVWSLAATAARAQSTDAWPDGSASQRPLATVDPLLAEPGWLVVEIGAAFAHDREIPAVGLRGNVLRVPELTLRLNVARRVELRVDTGYEVLFVHERSEAPLSAELDYDGESSSDIRDPLVSTLVRVRDESEGAPALGLKIATRLPVASNQSGLGLDTTDFFLALLASQDAGGLRWVANVGLGILEVPTAVTSQNDVLTYGFSVSRGVGERLALAAGVDGHVDLSGQVHPGTEDTSVLRLGGRFGSGASTIDAALLIGLAEIDAPIGITVGVTRAFRLFEGS
ncbi:MAG TPA: hypothetical protein VFH11_14865 [Gemmatimonadota bacterium]|nr:hypothetical protein [Gemmatimonadota bacterium]